jgi:Co/Zn/Cd efflux system component
MDDDDIRNAAVRRVVTLVALLNLAYFGIEFSVALNIKSVSLFADSVDFLEDASVNLLILLGLAWSARNRARLGMALAIVLLLPALATLWALIGKFTAPSVPEPFALSITGLGALVINLTCALMLARVRHHAGSITRAAFLSARNDAIANVAIIAAGLVTAWSGSIWPDVIVGVSIGIMNLDAAREVWEAARDEHEAAA